MEAEPSLFQLVQKILREDPRIAIVLAEILGPPPGLSDGPPRLWDK